MQILVAFLALSQLFSCFLNGMLGEDQPAIEEIENFVGT